MPPPPQHPITTRHVNDNIDLFLFPAKIITIPKAPIFPFFPFYPRRFVKIPTMSLHRRFATPQSLSDWLRPRLRSDSLASWGVKPGTKNVHNLWLELAEGESSLLDSSPPIRTVHVVTVKVVDPTRTKVLIESQQLLSDGSLRTRGRPLSEKMKPHEDPISAANRAVKEELGSGRVEIVPGSYRKEVEERSSASYPGLPACYELHTVEATVEGLPEEEEFITEEEHEYDAESGEEARVASEAAVSVKKHFWKWDGGSDESGQDSGASRVELVGHEMEEDESTTEARCVLKLFHTKCQQGNICRIKMAKRDSCKALIGCW